MKKILAIILVAFFVAQAGNINVPCSKSRSGVYEMSYGDTMPLQTGNSATVYLDTTTATRKGISDGLLTGDSLAVLLYGYGDADSTQVQVKISESPNAGLNYITVKTDTLGAMTASANSKLFKVKKNPDCQYRVVLTGYGSSDSTNILGARIWGE